MQDLQDLVVLQHAEEPVEEDLEADGRRLRPVKHQTGDVEDGALLDYLHLHAEYELGTSADRVESWTDTEVKCWNDRWTYRLPIEVQNYDGK